MRAPHASDRDLILALDGELSPSRQSAVDAHLAVCPSCLARQTELRHAGNSVAWPDTSGTEHDRLQKSRERLRVELSGLAQHHDRTLSAALGATILRIPRWARLAAAAAATIVLVHGVQQNQSRMFQTATTAFADGALPVSALTPGATKNLSIDELCTAGDREPQPIARAVRDEVVRRYGMERVPSDEYELDYLITPELGGTPAVENLWPQRYASRIWNAHVKDELEDLLPTLVCNGTLPLKTAQRDIANDWIAAYKKYFHTDSPLPVKVYASNSFGATLRFVSFSPAR